MRGKRCVPAVASAMLMFSTQMPAQDQNPAKVWYFSRQPSGPATENIILRPANELEASWIQMAGQPAICAMDEEVFRNSGNPSTLKQLLEGGNPVIVVGEKIQPGTLRGRVMGRQDVARGGKSQPAVADGIYMDRNGRYNDFTVSSIAPISTSTKLNEIRQELGALAFGNAKPGTAQWAQRDSASQDLLDPGFGKIVQSMTPYLLSPSPDGTDHWYARLDIAIKAERGSMAKAQSVKVDSSQTSGTSCYGPQSRVASRQDAVVSLSCEGPKVQWSWQTLESEVAPNSGPAGVVWQTVFPGAAGSGPHFWWCPGLSVKNLRGQLLELNVSNEVTWIDGSGKTVTHTLVWPRPLISRP